MTTVSKIQTWAISAGKFLSLPIAARSRLLVLFVALAGVKVALILSLGKKLYETHWRLTPHEPAWGGYVLFGVFVLIGLVSLGRLQRHCAMTGTKATRVANAIVLVLGMLFIFLTFQAQGKNYLF